VFLSGEVEVSTPNLLLKGRLFIMRVYKAEFNVEVIFSAFLQESDELAPLAKWQ
jgi:hypothetical protein